MFLSSKIILKEVRNKVGTTKIVYFRNCGQIGRKFNVTFNYQYFCPFKNLDRKNIIHTRESGCCIYSYTILLITQNTLHAKKKKLIISSTRHMSYKATIGEGEIEISMLHLLYSVPRER